MALNQNYEQISKDQHMPINPKVKLTDGLQIILQCQKQHHQMEQKSLSSLNNQ